MPQIQFGEAESRLRFALRGGGLGGISFIVPRFGRRCVCCSADAMGRTQDYDASTERIQAPGIPMPVCFACKDHALVNPNMGVYQACVLIVGGCALGLGISKLGQEPDGFLKGMIVFGALVLLAGIVWTAVAFRREKRARIPGHHPWLGFSIDGGRTVLGTHNDELVVELLALNPSARLLPVPPRRRRWWWRRNRELPEARALKARVPADDDEEGERLAAYLAANPPDAQDERDGGGHR